MSTGSPHAAERHAQQPPPVDPKQPGVQGGAPGLEAIVPASPRGAGAKRGRSQGPVDLTEEQREAKRQRRLLQNRQSAAASRARKKDFVESLRANEDNLKNALRESMRELGELKAIMDEIPPHVIAAARQKAQNQMLMRSGREAVVEPDDVHLPIAPAESKMTNILETDN